MEKYRVIHPMDDAPEEKVGTAIGPIKMTTSVKVSLYVLRGYLIAMMLLVVYRTLELAGMWK